MQKTCFKCKESKPFDCFYKHSKMKDGLLNKCKDCTRKDVSNNLLKNRDYYLNYDKKRANLPHRVAQRKAYSISENGKLVQNKAKKDYIKKNPLKRKAVQKVNNYLRYHPEFKQPCCICGQKAQAHHHDYNKPLDVIWFCSKHHAEEHKRLRALNKDPDHIA